MLVIFIACLLRVHLIAANDAPIIGVLTLPCDFAPKYCVDNSTATTYLPASYVKWLESGGARVVPIKAHFTTEWILITGGAADANSFWYAQLENILRTLRTFTKSEQQFGSIPLWSTCLGFEYVQCAIAGTPSIHVPHVSEDKALKLNFTALATNSSVFDSATMDSEYARMVYHKLSTLNLTMNFHKYGISPSAYHQYPHLNGNFSILATNVDDSGEEFISMIQSKDNAVNGELNWFGTQFHPEKPAYIFDADQNENHIVHSLNAIVVNQYFSQWFVEQCRAKNQNVMHENVYRSQVIYNSALHFVFNGTLSYEQVYLF